MIAWNSAPVPDVPGAAGPVSLYDTAQQRVVEVDAARNPSMYVCGITPYDATHLGHASTYVAFDLLNRIWRDAGAGVRYVQNVTDVDDPLLERAAATGIDWRDLATQQIDLFRADMEALNVLAPDHYIGAVEAVEWIVPVVEQLVADGYAYTLAGDGEHDDVYFSVEAAQRPGYTDTGRGVSAAPWELGGISHLSRQEMLPLFAERGGDPDREGKKDALDPLLWRSARDGEPRWDGRTLGPGRPGWHIECTVIAQRFLPSPFTVQGGGSDLVFPHHEMSAGHAAGSGHQLAKHYAHAGMVGYEGGKMSKSRGNLVLVSRLTQAGVEPAAIRVAILGQHYRSDWSWTDELLEAATARLASWRRARGFAQREDVAALVGCIRAALTQDLDAPTALGAVDQWAEQATSSRKDAAPDPQAQELLGNALDALLGIRLVD